MGLVRLMLIALAAGSYAATPAAAAQLIAVDQDMCIVQDGAVCLTAPDQTHAAARIADVSKLALLAGPELYDAQAGIRPDVQDGDDSAALHKMDTLPEAANWALLAGGFCLISFTLRGSREPMLRRPQRGLQG